jgi:hypothetical protein
MYSWFDGIVDIVTCFDLPVEYVDSSVDLAKLPVVNSFVR